jgi:peptide subunit release factor RF-3
MTSTITSKTFWLVVVLFLFAVLYGGALQQAGAVRQKAEQRATQSDFMEMEKERGISISSTVMNFDYEGYRLNILDTPGHQEYVHAIMRPAKE